jgi:signal transduction histidine kinase
VKGSRLQIPLIFGLLALLGLLAFLQYSWLTQISIAEKDRLQKRLKIDTERFAEDFNKEIQSTYFAFQLNDGNWRQAITERFETWKQNASYPKIIKSFTVVTKDDGVFTFDQESKSFLAEEVSMSFATLTQDFQSIDEKSLTLRLPVFGGRSITDEFKGKSDGGKLPNRIELVRTSDVSSINAYLVIKLDDETLKNEILTSLGQKYFPDGDFYFSISSENNKAVVFQTNELTFADESVSFFSLKPNSMSFLLNKNLLSTVENTSNHKVVFSQKFETHVSQAATSAEKNAINVVVDDKPRVFSGTVSEIKGLWNLNVSHKEGSLENYVNKTRNQNLAISYGILSLLGVSIGFILVSANRARNFAQRQVDFVSSVSHEFRTPLAVIYSAGENLTDGVVNSAENVATYGNLIKREGAKMSVMIEQILEFAGANSGKRKYKFESVMVSELIGNVLSDNRNLLEKEGFTIETEIDPNLRSVIADRNSLSQAIQNLILNSIKYSKQVKFLKITAKTKGDGLIIAVEDKGIGISTKDQKHIFEPFFRGKEVVDEQIHGNGLGLSLVKQIIDAHGGKLIVESEIGIGSRFSIHLSGKKIG